MGARDFSILDAVRDRRLLAAWARKVPPTFAVGQRHENVGQSRVRAEPRQQAVKAVAPGSTAAWAVDTNDV
jgi:hypothetical protein